MSESPGHATRLRLASRYLRTRYNVLRFATRRGRWNADGLSVSMLLALDPGDTFLDIGANVGWVTAAASYLVGPGGAVHSFEPSPTTRISLDRRLKRLSLSNVTVHPFALGDTPGTAVLHEYAENFGGASSLKAGAWPGHHEVRETQVPVVVLDDHVRHLRSPIRMIKIDVQGAEVEVLAGARTLLTSPAAPLLFIEVERDAQAAFGRSPTVLLERIAEYGYEMVSWRHDGLTHVTSAAQLPADGHDDVICMKAGTHADFHRRLAALADRHP